MSTIFFLNLFCLLFFLYDLLLRKISIYASTINGFSSLYHLHKIVLFSYSSQTSFPSSLLSVHSTFSILFHNHILKLSKYFFLSDHLRFKFTDRTVTNSIKKGKKIIILTMNNLCTYEIDLN